MTTILFLLATLSAPYMLRDWLDDRAFRKSMERQYGVKLRCLR